MNDKKSFTYKFEKSDAVLSPPKTPVKRVPYKNIFSPPPPQGEMLSFPLRISKGDFFEVFLRRHSPSPCLYNTECTAVRKSLGVVRNELERESILREVEVLKKISSPHVIKYISHWDSNKYIYIEVEYCNLGTLREYMNFIYFSKKETFTPSLTRKIIKEIALGLEEIHRLKIVHLDLKPENIFLKSKKRGVCSSKDVNGDVDVCSSKNGSSKDVNQNVNGDKTPPTTPYCSCSLPEDESLFSLKIGDFNISRYEGEEIEMDGDKKYMAPEVLEGVCTRKSDVFSLGLIYLEILNGIILPSQGEEWLNLREEKFKGIKVEGVLKEMLSKDHKKRIDTSKVLTCFK